MKKPKKTPASYLPANANTKLIESFLLHLEIERSLSENTIRSYNFDLVKFNNFLNDLKVGSMLSAAESHIERFLAYLKKDNRSSTTARIISSLRQFYDFLIDTSRLYKNPFEYFDSPKLVRKLPVVLTFAEVEQILKQPDVTNTL